MKQIDLEVDVVPENRFGIRVVPTHTRHWFRNFVPTVKLNLDVAIDEGKLSPTYSMIYNNV